MPANKSGQCSEKVTTSSHFSEKSLITHEQLKDIMEDRLNYIDLRPSEVLCKSFFGISNFPFCLEQECNSSVEISKVEHLVLAQSKVPQSDLPIKYEPSSFELSTNKHLQISKDLNGERPVFRNSNVQTTINFFGKHQNSIDNEAIGVSSPTKIVGNKTFMFDDVMHDDIEEHNHKPMTILGSLANTPIKIASGKSIKSDSELLDDVLLLDCRSFLSYNVGHIKTAQNVHFPDILQRRCKKKIVENITKCRTSNVAIANEHGGDMTGKTFSSHKTDDIQRPFGSSMNCGNSLENQTAKGILEPSQHSFPPQLTISSSQNPAIPLESIVRSDRQRKRLLLGDFRLIVIYDDYSEDNPTCLTTNQQVAFSEKLILVLNTLSSLLPGKQLSKLRCLQGWCCNHH